jgi:hypothetical protein
MVETDFTNIICTAETFFDFRTQKCANYAFPDGIQLTYLPVTEAGLITKTLDTPWLGLTASLVQI